MRVLFMGTPDFAVSSLKALLDAGYEVIGAVTQEDRPKGRGYQLIPTPVKAFALERGIPVYQPKTLKGGEFAQTLEELHPDLIAVAAYGKILPHNVIAYPEYGCINVHGSLLPEYRGAAPMQRAVIDGKTFTGITTMYMDDGLDTGDMLLRCRVDIGHEDNFETVHDRMAEAGASLLIETLKRIEDGTAERIPQASAGTEPTYAAKILKSDCLLDFTKPAEELHNLIRGLSPVPLAFTYLPDGRLLKTVKSAVGEKGHAAVQGTVVGADKNITVACGPEGTDRLCILELIPEGKGRMNAADFVRGRRIAAGDILGNRKD